MKIILIGMKGCGKTTIGKLISERLHIPFIDSDSQIEKIYSRKTGERLTFRKIFKKHGEEYFNELDKQSLLTISDNLKNKNFVLACAGRTPLQKENQKILAHLGKIIFLDTDKKVLLKRIIAQGIPAFFPYQDNPEKSLDELFGKRIPVYEKLADIVIKIKEETPEEIVSVIADKLKNMKINGETQIIGFFGSTFRTSKMYAMYNAAFEKLQLNCIYVPFAVTELEKAVSGIKNLGIKAVGITIPYKIEIIKYLDELDDDAKRIGAVNVVINQNGKLIGGNTDGKGAVMALKEETEISGNNVLLLGAGGAARAIAFAITNERGELTILNRTKQSAQNLAKESGSNYGTYDDLPKEIKKADIIINATPIGMSPKENETLIAKELLSKDKIVMDLISKPKETLLLKNAKEKGCKLVYGERMLFWQGVLKFKMFTGIEPPIDIMEKALKGN